MSVKSQAGFDRRKMIRLKKAHNGAFEENIANICTNRLFKLAKSVRNPALLFPVWITGKRKGLWKAEEKVILSLPVGWEFNINIVSSQDESIGRKDRKLVIRLRAQWSPSLAPGYDSSFSWEKEEREILYVHTYMTDIEIFPLTPQQAAFVGTKNLSSTTNVAVFWGTKEDVLEIQNKFSIASIV